MQRIYEHRDDEGLSTLRQMSFIKQSVENGRTPRWPTTMQGRQNNVNLIENTIADENKPIFTRLMAAKIHTVLEGQNQADDRMQMAADAMEVGSGGRQPEIVLVLPSNGSELGSVRDDDNTGLDEADEGRIDGEEMPTEMEDPAKNNESGSAGLECAE